MASQRWESNLEPRTGSGGWQKANRTGEKRGGDGDFLGSMSRVSSYGEEQTNDTRVDAEGEDWTVSSEYEESEWTREYYKAVEN